MAKKKDEKDVLVVRDEKTGEISVVAGLNADGSPKRIPAKAENAQSFLQFDRHGDVLDNFFRNFFRQCREPSRFGFYRVAADQADKLLEVIKDLLKDPDGNKEMLAPHKVDTSGYEKKVQEEQSAEKQEQPEQKQDDEPKKQEEMEQKNEQNQESPQQTQGNRGYQPIDESKINWQKLEEKWGVKRDDLEKSGDLDRMLNYGKSDLVRVSPNFGGEAFELDARLSFKKDGEGNVSLVRVGCVFRTLRLFLLIFLCLDGTGRPAGSRHELHAALLHVHLQGGDELSAVVALDELVAYGQSGAEHVPLLRGDFRLADALRDAHPACRNVRDFIRLAVDADVGGDDLARFPVHNVHDPTEIARFAEVLPVIVGEFVFLVLIQLLLLADEVRHEADVSLTVLLEGEAGVQLE